MSIDGKKLLNKITKRGWVYQRLTQSGKENYDESMTMFCVLKKGETWNEN